MRRLILAITCLTLLTGLITTADCHAATAWIGGRLTNCPCSTVTINQSVVALDSSGTFHVQLALDDPALITFVYTHSQQFFFADGDTLDIQVNCGDSNLGEMKLFGNRLAENSVYMMLSEAILTQQDEITKTYRTLFALPEREFASDIDKRRASLGSLLDSKIGLYKVLHPDFVAIARARILFHCAGIRRAYPSLHRDLTGQPGYEPDPSFYDYLRELDFNRPALLDLTEYAEFTNQYISDQVDAELAHDKALAHADNQRLIAAQRVIDRTFRQPTVRCYWMYSILANQLSNFDAKGIDTVFADYDRECRATNAYQEISSGIWAERSRSSRHQVYVYKTVDGITLDAHVYDGDSTTLKTNRPAIVLLHGGGWSVGSPLWCERLAQGWAEEGIVAIAGQYRLADRHGSTPIESMRDAKSLIRWVRRYSDSLGIDPNRIAAYGWSAGGHLLATAAMVPGFNEPGEDTTIDPSPNALLLLYAPMDLGTDTWFAKSLAGREDVHRCAPITYVRSGLPPTIIWQGTADDVVPATGAKAFADAMLAAGNRCELHLFEGRGHLFTRSTDDGREVQRLAAEFLKSLGYIE